MARTMTITQEESATTSPLFLGFFFLAAGFLLFGSILSYDAQPVDAVPAVPAVVEAIK